MVKARNSGLAAAGAMVYPAVMKPWGIMGRILFAAAVLTVAAAFSMSRHAALLAYGLNLSAGAMTGGIIGWLLLSLCFTGLFLGIWGGLKLPGWTAAALVLLCAVAGALSAFSIYLLEVKYEKGESDLRKLGKYCRDLPAWEARSEELRKGILGAARLDPPPARRPLNPVIHSRREHEGYSVENVILETVPGFFLAGNLYRPLPAVEGAKIPVVIIPHGHFPHGRFNPDTQLLASAFARMGALAFLYDMAGRGETTQVSHDDPNALTLQLWNSMRVLDFMLALPGADAERVAMTGASGGGTQTFLCAAVDKRVTLSAPVVMVSSWMYGGCACESGLPIHRSGMSGFGTNNAEIAALAGPRPQLIVSIDADWTRTVPEREFPYIRGVYALYHREAFLKNKHFAGEAHDFGPSKRSAVCMFVAGHFMLDFTRVLKPVSGAEGGTGKPSSLGNRTVREFDDGAVEAEEVMRAFDAEHPLPAGALRGWDAVMASLRGTAPETGERKEP